MTGLSTERDRLVSAAQAVRGESLWRAAAARFVANRSAVAGLVMLGLIVGFSLLAPLFSPHDMEETYWERIQIAPTLEESHWFGTDANGRDLFVRVAAGGRISLAIGLVTALTSLLIGVVYGAIAGYVGGRTDEWMMRFVDVLYALPLIFFIIILVTVFGRNILLVFLAIGCIEWLTIAKSAVADTSTGVGISPQSVNLLANDVADLLDYPDTLHLSDGSRAPVAVVLEGRVDGEPSATDLEVTLTAPLPVGWAYLRIPDPGQGRFRLDGLAQLVDFHRLGGREIHHEDALAAAALHQAF